jgi:hypothetical protein
LFTDLQISFEAKAKIGLASFFVSLATVQQQERKKGGGGCQMVFFQTKKSQFW